MRFEIVVVECYSGYKANEKPVAFTWQGEHRKVVRILDRWYEGGRESDSTVFDYYKIVTDAGDEFILRYNRVFRAWGAFRCTVR